MSGLAAKLRAIKDELGDVKKTGFNSFQNYWYHTEADILDAVKPLLAKHQVDIIPSLDWDHADVLGAPASVNGDISSVFTKYIIVDTETGEERVIYWYGQGQDKGDKGANKAFTAAGKYAMIKLFQIATDEDPDSEGAPANKPAASKPAPKPASPPSSTPPGKCEDCGKTGVVGKVVDFSKVKFNGHVYCMECQGKHRQQAQ